MRPRVKGKFFYLGSEKLYIRGVTYGTFRPDASANEFQNPAVVEKDFAQMAGIGINVVRTYTSPPRWLLDTASRKGLHLMVGLPWEQHVTFLDSRKAARSIEDRVRRQVREIAGHPALLCYVIGNEIPSPIVRWHGRKKIEHFLKRLYAVAKKEDPDGLVTYVNYPTTEYLQLPFLDFHCFNVYLEEHDRLESYLSRLQNLAGDLPLVMGEIGLDSRRNGEQKQATVLDWQIRTIFRLGCAGAFVFAWTDEWHRGGYDINDWDFGLTTRNRRPKEALQSVQKAFSEVPFPPDVVWPKISVVVCSYNGSRTIRQSFEGLRNLDYPDVEVIVVDDGSTDETAAIAGEYGFRLISTENRGLSNARNTGLAAATGEIVAYIDDDAFPDRDWLKYLAAKLMATDCAGAGGPNVAPPCVGKIADCVANAPGNPMHVLVSDQEAEHLPGCNMAFRRHILQAIGGFDPRFRTAGDDVDLCWRIRQGGWTLAFAPAAMVWHHRRNSVRTYWKQQIGYGKAEALLERKWPQKYNAIGHINWSGRIYGNGHTKQVGWRRWRIYYGTWGSALFQSLYGHRSTLLQSLPLMPEWYMVNLALLLLSILGFMWKPLLMALPLLVVTAGLPLINVTKSMTEPSFNGRPLSITKRLRLRLLIGLLHIIQPMARLCGRLSFGLTPWRRHGTPYYEFPWPRKYEMWSENWQAPDKWLASIKAAIVQLGAIVKRGGDFDHWDLEIRGGLCGTARLQMAIEEHGGGKQLVRFRTWAIVYPIGWILILMFAILSLWAAVDQRWLPAALLCSAAVGLSINVFQDCAAAIAACRQALRTHKAPNMVEVEIENDVAMGNGTSEAVIFLDIDHRQNRGSNYRGPERRQGIERRGNIIFGRFGEKQHISSHYRGPERRSGIERRNAFTASARRRGGGLKR